MIEEYFWKIEKIIREFPNIRCYFISKKIYSDTQGYINGSITFDNDHRLDFVEVKNTNTEHKIKYRYHYMNENQEMLFRYDNAPHHSEIKTFPHHKHEQGQIVSSQEPNLYDVLLEIFRLNL
jgi:hypothetical protein